MRLSEISPDGTKQVYDIEISQGPNGLEGGYDWDPIVTWMQRGAVWIAAIPLIILLISALISSIANDGVPVTLNKIMLVPLLVSGAVFVFPIMMGLTVAVVGVIIRAAFKRFE